MSHKDSDIDYNESMDCLCKSCGLIQQPNPCDHGCNKRCQNDCCGRPMPVFAVDNVPDDILTLSFNFDGVGSTYDYTEMIRQGQTDTSISLNVIKRILTYMAERHTDTITAQELGSILHLGDIGDVNLSSVNDKAMLFFNKETECTQACDGTTNSWTGWTALDNQSDSLSMIMGFSNDGSPLSLSSPSQPNSHYILSWSAGEKAKWVKPKVVTDKTNLLPLYIDKTTGEIVQYGGE